jgi:hypothetical protein
MDSLTAFEIKAATFLIMTGHMAPGKDPAPASYSAPFEERYDAWDKWTETYGECVRAVLLAVEKVTG